MIMVGYITSPHGLCGEVKVISDFSYKSDVYKLNNILVINNQTYKIENIKKTPKFLILKLKNIDSIENAKTILKSEIFFEKESLYKKYSYIIEEVINYSVYDNCANLGVVVEVLKNKSCFFIRVKEKNNKTFLIPVIDEFICSVDRDAKKIYTNGGSEFIL